MNTQLSEEPSFYQTLLRLALPIAAQQFVMNALNAVDVLMIGQLGESAVAAVGLANQIFFLLSLFLFGVGSGSAVFSAQFWGRGDVASLRRVLGIGLRLALIGAALFSLAAILAPARLLAFYTRDAAVIAAGSGYLRTVGLCYIPTAVSVTFGIVLRSTRHMKVPITVSIAALGFKTLLAYALIFGRFGLPALGIMGAAIATVTARCLECAAILLLSYRLRLPVAARPDELRLPDRAFLAKFVRTTLPVVAGEILWSLGITTYNAVYARISTESIAAVNIAGTIEGIALVPFMGLGNACAILLGNQIGAGRTQDAPAYARRFLAIAVAGGAAFGVLLALLSRLVLDLYRISPAAQGYVSNVLLVMASVLWLKAANMVIIVGILRSGGDTRFGLLNDTGPMWVLGVPAALAAAFLLHLPVHWVVLLVVIADEATKFVLGMWRVLSGRWINNVVGTL